MALCQTSVLKVYNAVIDDVITNVRDAFLDEGVDEQVLQEMKQIWRAKLFASKALEVTPDPPEPQPPQIIVNNPKPSKAAVAKAKKAAAAAAAAAAQQNNNNATSASDVKPNVVAIHSNHASNIINSGNASTSNGVVKTEKITQSNPPPLHPTSAALKTIANHGPSTSQTPQQGTIPIVASLDPNRIMPVNITLPAQPGTINSESRVLTIHVPASALQENQLTQILTANLISSIMSLPATLASSVLQQHVNAALTNANIRKSFTINKQLDGAHDGSDEEDEDDEDDDDEEDDNDDDDDPDKDDDEDIENEGGAEEEPLNSEDDVTDEDGGDLFETDNVIVCQYDKITRSRNKWKFYLKDGIMNIGGKDYVFQKSNGDAEW